MCQEEEAREGAGAMEKSGSCGAAMAKISSFAAFSPMERICEDTVATANVGELSNFFPNIRSGEWSDIGSREYMEDAHVCISDLAKKFGHGSTDAEAVSFYGVFDGHGGEGAAQFVRDNLPRIVVEDYDFPLKLEKVMARSFLQTDTQFARTCAVRTALSSGTTALTATIHGRTLLVANAGDCRAVLSRRGAAIEMSRDHRPCYEPEQKRAESLGGFIDDGYLNGQLAVTRALGNWHLEGMKTDGQTGAAGPLTAEPELTMTTLSREDEFLIIGSDGIWDVFSSQNAVDFVRRQLQEHNDLQRCCKEMVEEAIKRGTTDNLTAVIVCFHLSPPANAPAQRGKLRRTISAEGLHSLKCLLEERQVNTNN